MNLRMPIGGLPSLWRIQVIVGTVLLALGLLIAIYPRLLEALVSGFFVVVGFMLLLSGLRGRRARAQGPQVFRVDNSEWEVH